MDYASGLLGMSELGHEVLHAVQAEALSADRT
jgi:hypothetical protein